MRFTITADECEPLILRSQVPGNQLGWWVIQGGIRGWFGSPDVREDAIERKMSDGDLFPPRITQGARILTLDVAAICESSIEAVKTVDAVNAFIGRKLTILGEDASGGKTVYGFLAEDTAPQFLADGVTVLFTLIIKCPDPYKYGEWTTFSQYGGNVHVINGGNAPSYPKVHVAGQNGNNVTYMTLSHAGRQVTWTGNAPSFDLDFADMVPSVGTVSIDNAFSIEPGEQVVTVSSNGLVTMYIRSAWR